MSQDRFETGIKLLSQIEDEAAQADPVSNQYLDSIKKVFRSKIDKSSFLAVDCSS